VNEEVVVGGDSDGRESPPLPENKLLIREARDMTGPPLRAKKGREGRVKRKHGVVGRR